MTREDAMEALDECRAIIDELDLRILKLINERAGVVERIGQIKQSVAMPIYEPARETQVYENVIANNAGPLEAGAVKRVYERIIDEMRKVQRDRMDGDRIKVDRDECSS